MLYSLPPVLPCQQILFLGWCPQQVLATIESLFYVSAALNKFWVFLFGLLFVFVCLENQRTTCKLPHVVLLLRLSYLVTTCAMKRDFIYFFVL
uniref:Uncharacterized protein n=1 Tax=Rhipicephalus zambeziensis TaxID=60191 RepID=A0A224Y6R2_9ACAR